MKKNNFWKKSLKIIPGGNLLYSKRPEMFLPEYWPTYFKKSKDVYVWDNWQSGGGSPLIDYLTVDGSSSELR